MVSDGDVRLGSVTSEHSQTSAKFSFEERCLQFAWLHRPSAQLRFCSDSVWQHGKSSDRSKFLDGPICSWEWISSMTSPTVVHSSSIMAEVYGVWFTRQPKNPCYLKLRNIKYKYCLEKVDNNLGDLESMAIF